MKNILFTAVLTALVTFVVGFAYNCDHQQDCSNCPSVEHCQKTVPCGCCSICIKIISENETCMSMLYLITQSSAECAEGLLCNPNTKKCTSDHSFLKQLQSESDLLAKGNNIPDVVTCKGDVCHCSFKEKVLEEYDSLHSSEVTPNSCKCAVKKAEYRKLKLLGKIFMCTKNGSFERVQCTGSVCYCADEEGEQLKDQDAFSVGDFQNNSC